MGGETLMEVSVLSGVQGLSPRGRGNLIVADRDGISYRSIPAWAGKPCCTEQPWETAKVYPRVGGETVDRALLPSLVGGLSPRGRGNLLAAVDRPPTERSIPAWAGKPPHTIPKERMAPVYPRVGGETSAPIVSI